MRQILNDDICTLQGSPEVRTAWHCDEPPRSANQSDQSVTQEADPEVDRQSPIDLVDVVLPARRQVSLGTEVNRTPDQHSNQGLPERPFHEARHPSRVAIMESTGFQSSILPQAAAEWREKAIDGL